MLQAKLITQARSLSVPFRTGEHMRTQIMTGARATMFLMLLTCFSLTIPVQAQQSLSEISKCAPDLLQRISAFSTLISAEPIPVIIVGERGNAPRLQRLLQTPVLRNIKVVPIDSVGSYRAVVTPEQLAILVKERSVYHLSPDHQLRASYDYQVSSVGADIARTNLGLQGSGVRAAVLDTGVYPHKDLINGTTRIIAFKDFVGNKTAPYDDNGHGTHVAGILAGDGSAATQGRYSMPFARIAPRTEIISVKVLDKDGNGTVSTVIAGIDWCIANRAVYNIRIINLSLGHPVGESYMTDPLCQAVERAWNAGIFVVCAAGNRGRSIASDPNSAPAYGTIDSPGNDPKVMTVGAMNTLATAIRGDDKIASYSSRGPSAIDLVMKPDIVAPGNGIESLADPTGTLYLQYSANRVQAASYKGIGLVQYYRLSGTSMATPVVSGAAALMLQADPTLTPDTIKARLMVSADKPVSSDPLSMGAGYLNIPAAIASRIGAPMGASSGAACLGIDGLVYVNSDIWGNNVVWGNNAIWGNNINACNAIWGNAKWKINTLWTSGLWNGSAQIVGTPTLIESLTILVNGD